MVARVPSDTTPPPPPWILQDLRKIILGVGRVDRERSLFIHIKPWSILALELLLLLNNSRGLSIAKYDRTSSEIFGTFLSFITGTMDLPRLQRSRSPKHSYLWPGPLTLTYWEGVSSSTARPDTPLTSEGDPTAEASNPEGLIMVVPNMMSIGSS